MDSKQCLLFCPLKFLDAISISTSSQVCPSPVRPGLDFGLGLGLGLANLDENVNGPELDNLLTMFQKLCKPLIQSPD